ncbi:MAG: metalloregulator ArsR/SmtB family transcription factor [Paracoccaceae bacterium]
MTSSQQPAFRALADPTRREILQRLTHRNMTIGEVADGFEMTRAAVKKHLTVLSDGGLITMTPKGREVVTQVDPLGFAPIRDWLSFFEHFWDSRLDSLKTAIEQENNHDANDQ